MDQEVRRRTFIPSENVGAYLAEKENNPPKIPDIQQMTDVQRGVLQEVNKVLWDWMPKKVQDLPDIVRRGKKEEMQRIGFEELSKNPELTEMALRCRISFRLSA